MKKSTTARIISIAIYLAVALPLFVLGVNNIITQTEFMLAIVVTAFFLVIAVMKVTRDEKRQTPPEPKQQQKY